MTLVDRLQATEPAERPSKAAEVADRLEAIARQMQSSPSGSENPDSAANDVALQFRSSLKRRAFFAHSFGLMATAGVSMWGGSALGKWWAAPKRHVDAIVPGWAPKYKLALEIDTDHGSSDPWEPPQIIRSRRGSNIPIDLARPTKPNEWAAVYSKPVRLPDDEILITLINGSIEFNCAPGDAEFVLESKLSSERSWTQLVSLRNHFGGLFGRAFDASLPRYQLRPNELVSLRARVRYRGAALDNDAYPVGICLGLNSSTSFMTLGVWCRKEGE